MIPEGWSSSGETDTGASAASGPSIDPDLVSVVIPAFNRAHCIARALQSVVDQSYPAIEIIVVDDRSTDGTVGVVRSLHSARPVRVVRLARQHGAPGARNVGIRIARGAYIAFLDSDDVWHPSKLERQIALLKQRGEEFGACYTGIASYNEAGELSGVSRARAEGDLRLELRNHNLVGSTSCVLVRRELLRAAGGFTPALRSCQDWDLWLRLAERTKFACVPEFLTIIEAASKGRITTSGKARLSGHLYMYRTHLRPHFRSGAVDPTLFRSIVAEALMQRGRPRSAARLLFLNWRAKPRSLKRAALFLLASLRMSATRFARAGEILSRVEDRLRPTAIVPPLGAAREALRALLSMRRSRPPKDPAPALRVRPLRDVAILVHKPPARG